MFKLSCILKGHTPEDIGIDGIAVCAVCNKAIVLDKALAIESLTKRLGMLYSAKEHTHTDAGHLSLYSAINGCSRWLGIVEHS